ncbi:Dyp-type peroxidase [Aestuariibacter sp. AA17]|uniref:Dyp-type peroxidase n=1 Tax=Fluctibacter corallii TaxID=2984329 RepID=A0ABT3A703_9ALTE|nr:Dyp-type peroxidase [Aestuariibacter sp. AA17]MCV2884357.1 Dyp-type peroxidase [Aestuariibacter sp. AA17]
MAQPQKGICAEPNLHAQYLMFNVVDDDDQAIRAKLARILDIFEYYDNEHYEAMVTGVVAVGNNYWMELYPGLLPIELAPFPDMQCDDRCAPVVACDLFIQIRADRADICHAIGIEVYELLRLHVELVEEVRGFRYLDGRDLTGFIYAPDNPRGMKKLDAAIVGDNDPDFSGGSYLHVQRFRYDIASWNRLSQQQQEMIMGRNKETGMPLASELLLPSAHLARTQLKNERGDLIPLLKQSMPYGDMATQGLYFVSCCSSPKPFKNMLYSMIYGDESGQYDAFLDYATVETGAAFFAPSVTFIKQQALID